MSTGNLVRERGERHWGIFEHIYMCYTNWASGRISEVWFHFDQFSSSNVDSKKILVAWNLHFEESSCSSVGTVFPFIVFLLIEEVFFPWKLSRALLNPPHSVRSWQTRHLSQTCFFLKLLPEPACSLDTELYVVLVQHQWCQNSFFNLKTVCSEGRRKKNTACAVNSPTVLVLLGVINVCKDLCLATICATCEPVTVTWAHLL